MIKELPFVSIVMPVHNESGFIARSLRKVLEQDYPCERFEVIVADGCSSDDTNAIVESFKAEYLNLKTIPNPGKIVPKGLNAAIAEARGEIIVRVDGHCEIAPDYVRCCVGHILKDGVDGVGGPLETVGETPSGRAIAAAMSSAFGVGGAAFRTVKNRTMLADTVAFPAYTRAIIDLAGPFDEELVRNQDDEYNYRLRKLGAKILLAPDVRARYYSRSSLSKLIRQYFQYGYWKVRVLQKHPLQMSSRQFMPPAFVASLIASSMLAIFTPFGFLPLASIFCCYLTANLAASAWTAHRSSWKHLPLLPAVYASLHISYGFGFMVGLLKFAPRWLRTIGRSAPAKSGRATSVLLAVCLLPIAAINGSRASAPAPSPAIERGRPADIYVAPNGSSSGDGTAERPLDLATALSGNSASIQPGDTVWLRGGTYRGSFTSNLTGTQQNPITVRQSPGERAIIDGANSAAPVLTINGAWTRFWGFEITNSAPDRTNTRANGLMIFGPHTELINLTVHDTGVGMGVWTPAVDAEIYGCIVYCNGWQGPPPDRGHGHGIYAQNAVGTKRIADNIIFDQYGYGIHNYAEAGELKGFHIEGNIIFGNGSSAKPDAEDDPNIFIGGHKPAERISLIDNYTYHPRDKIATNVRLNYDAQNNGDLFLRGNYLAGGAPLLVTEWLRVTATDNILIGHGTLATVRMPRGVSPSAYIWDHNTYYTTNSTSASPFNFEDRSRSSSYTFTDWQQVTGFDRNSHQLRSASSNPAGSPAGVKVFIRPNLYETGRANIAIYNWDHKPEVEVNLGDLLTAGTRYEIRNVYDYFGAPVYSGLYDGKPVRLPMTGTRTGPEFNAFVLKSLGSLEKSRKV